MFLLFALLGCGATPCEELTPDACAASAECQRSQARDPCTGDTVYGGCAPQGGIGDGYYLLLDYEGDCLVYDPGGHPSDLEECTSPCVDTATYGL